MYSRIYSVKVTNVYVKLWGKVTQEKIVEFIIKNKKR